MPNTILNYSPENRTPYPRKGMLCLSKKLILNPGINTLSESDAKFVKTRPFFDEFVETNIFQVIGEVDKKDVDDEGKLTSTVNLAANEAVVLISKETDTEILEDWKSKENARSTKRKSVINNITRRIKAIKDGDM